MVSIIRASSPGWLSGTREPDRKPHQGIQKQFTKKKGKLPKHTYFQSKIFTDYPYPQATSAAECFCNSRVRSTAKIKNQSTIKQIFRPVARALSNP